MVNAFASVELHLLSQLKETGYAPSCIFDVGASNGEWSRMIANVYPDARYHLFEPLSDRLDIYRDRMAANLASHSNFTLHKIGLGDANGGQDMAIFGNGVGSTFIEIERIKKNKESLQASGHLADIAEFTVRRLDDYVPEIGSPQPNIVKMDTQGFELAIIKGGPEIIRQADILFLETWLFRGYGATTPLLHELMDELTGLGHTLVDFGDTYRRPSQRLTSIDAVFFSAAFMDRYKTDLPNVQWHV